MTLFTSVYVDQQSAAYINTSLEGDLVTMLVLNHCGVSNTVYLGFIMGILWVPTSITITITVHTVPSTVTVKKPYRTYTVS